MKSIFISTSLLIIAMFIIPVGGMSESNANREIYMYGFLACEILCVASLVRYAIILKRDKDEN